MYGRLTDKQVSGSVQVCAEILLIENRERLTMRATPMRSTSNDHNNDHKDDDDDDDNCDEYSDSTA